jgi:dTDP-4-amino-4,6-dideoxygalactose transaminase
MGRDALSLALSFLNLTADDEVLLPVYTCQDVVKAFIRNNRVLFYDVQPDLTIDPDAIKEKLAAHRIKVMVITNYFGFLQPFRKQIKEMCAQSGTCLIEDCAHSLLTPGSGETGDLVIYSFRKILPLTDGGGLKVNFRSEQFAPQFYPRAYSDALSILLKLKSQVKVRSQAFSRARMVSYASKVSPSAQAPKWNGRVLPLSYFAAKSMADMSFPQIVKRRREDFQFWQELARRSGFLFPVFSDLPADVCPAGFAIRMKDRSSIEARARSAGIPLSVHWRLDQTLGRECTASHELSRQTLTLPIYPELRPGQRETLARIVTQR